MDNPQNQMLGQGLHQFVMEAFDQHKDEFSDKMFIEEFRVQVSLGSISAASAISQQLGSKLHSVTEMCATR